MSIATLSVLIHDVLFHQFSLKMEKIQGTDFKETNLYTVSGLCVVGFLLSCRLFIPVRQRWPSPSIE